MVWYLGKGGGGGGGVGGRGLYANHCRAAKNWNCILGWGGGGWGWGSLEFQNSWVVTKVF